MIYRYELLVMVKDNLPVASLPMGHWGTFPLEFGKLLCILQLLSGDLWKFRQFPQKNLY